MSVEHNIIFENLLNGVLVFKGYIDYQKKILAYKETIYNEILPEYEIQVSLFNNEILDKPIDNFDDFHFYMLNYFGSVEKLLKYETYYYIYLFNEEHYSKVISILEDSELFQLSKGQLSLSNSPIKEINCYAFFSEVELNKMFKDEVKLHSYLSKTNNEKKIVEEYKQIVSINSNSIGSLNIPNIQSTINKIKVRTFCIDQANMSYISLSNKFSFFYDVGYPIFQKINNSRIKRTYNTLKYYKPDLIILSHFHADHVFGIPYLSNLTYSKPWIVPDIGGLSINIWILRFLAHVALKGNLYATKNTGLSKKIFTNIELYKGDGLKHSTTVTNNIGLYLVIKSMCNMILTGDVEYSAMCNQLISTTSFTFMNVPHHGGDMNYTNLISHQKNGYAYICAGLNNTYGHPHSNHINRLVNSGWSIVEINKIGSPYIDIYL